jgi:hypothetical protein
MTLSLILTICFVIQVVEDRKEVAVKSKEQLEAEKKAILEQRIVPIGDIGSMDEGGLKEKAKELHGILFRLESDKYDLEQHFKQRQYEVKSTLDHWNFSMQIAARRDATTGA